MNTENLNKSEHHYANLTPDTILSAVDSTGKQTNGRLLALNSYENRVYQVGIDDSSFIIAKFYRPERWSDDAIIEEHNFTIELAEQELPVVAPIINSDGNTLLEYEEFRFALYPRKGGRSPDLNIKSQRQWMGRFIGRIHLLGASRKFAHRPDFSIAEFGENPCEFLINSEFLP